MVDIADGQKTLNCKATNYKMGKIGKPERAPGYERAARERQEWEDTKSAYMRDPGFEEVLMEKYYSWTDHIQHVYTKYEAKLNDKCEWETVIVEPEKLLAARLSSIGHNYIEHDIEQRNDVIEAYGFSLEERVAMQDILVKKMRSYAGTSTSTRMSGEGGG